MKTPNGQCTKRCKWLKVTKTKKTSEKTKNQKKKQNNFQRVLAGTPPLPKSLEIFFLFFQGFTSFQRVLAGTPPLPESLEILLFLFFLFFVLFFWVFPRFLTSVGYFKETGMNHRQSCQSAFGSAVKHQ